MYIGSKSLLVEGIKVLHLKCYFSITVYIQCDFVLVSCVQHSGETIL